jgi:transcription termination factor Rho
MAGICFTVPTPTYTPLNRDNHMMNILELESKPLADLRTMALRDFGIQNSNRMKKEALVLRLRQEEAAREGLEIRGGILEIMRVSAFCVQPVTASAKMMCTSRRPSYAAMTCVLGI